MRAALLSSDVLKLCLERCGLVAYFEILQPAVMRCLDIREADSQSRWLQEVAATAGQVRPPLSLPCRWLRCLSGFINPVGNQTT
jgi:hypothetical protein